MFILLADVQINLYISLYIETLFFQAFSLYMLKLLLTATGKLHFTQGSAFSEYQSE